MRAPNEACVVLVPIGSHVEPECERSLVRLEARGYSVRRVSGYAAIDQGRSQMATDALADGFEEIMWVDSDVGFGIVLVYVALGLSALAGVGVSRMLRLDRPTTGSFINAIIVANNGYLGYPLCAALLGFDSLGQAVIYDVLVASPVLFLGAFGIGAAFGTKAGETAGERLRAYLTRNPPLLAAVAALLAPDSFAPDALVDASRIAVIALLPLGFFVVGSALAEEGIQQVLAKLERENGGPFEPREDELKPGRPRVRRATRLRGGKHLAKSGKAEKRICWHFG